jgi:hypothetical protein
MSNQVDDILFYQYIVDKFYLYQSLSFIIFDSEFDLINS